MLLGLDLTGRRSRCRWTVIGGGVGKGAGLAGSNRRRTDSENRRRELSERGNSICENLLAASTYFSFILRSLVFKA